MRISLISRQLPRSQPRETPAACRLPVHQTTQQDQITRPSRRQQHRSQPRETPATCRLPVYQSTQQDQSTRQLLPKVQPNWKRKAHRMSQRPLPRRSRSRLLGRHGEAWPKGPLQIRMRRDKRVKGRSLLHGRRNARQRAPPRITGRRGGLCSKPIPVRLVFPG